jgi:hypothetical protein
MPQYKLNRDPVYRDTVFTHYPMLRVCYVTLAADIHTAVISTQCVYGCRRELPSQVQALVGKISN